MSVSANKILQYTHTVHSPILMKTDRHVIGNSEKDFHSDWSNGLKIQQLTKCTNLKK